MLSKVVIQLLGSLTLYFSLSYFAMLDVRKHPYPHDFFDITLPEDWIIRIIANAFPFLSIIYRLITCKNLAVHIQRAAIMYILKGTIQFVTIIPAVNGVEDCMNRTASELILFGDNCADMMFSGHTGLTMLMLPKRWRAPCVLLVGLALKLARMHYTSDILMAILVVWQIERWIPEPGVTKSESQHELITKHQNILV